MKLSDFDFLLPKELIAQYPTEKREQSKLLVAHNGQLQDKNFTDVIDLLQEGDVLVFNDTKVIPAKLTCYKINSLGQKSFVNINLHQQRGDGLWDCFVKPAKKIKIGDEIFYPNGSSAAVATDRLADGQIRLHFTHKGSDFYDALNSHGKMPIPQYLGREANDFDNERYQTVYAKNIGAVAAPTAGLHFTDEIIQRIKDKKVEIAYVTLHVSGGTFLPVKTDNINEHTMHSESIELSQENHLIIKNAKRVIAVGTTSLRVLEGIVNKLGKLEPFIGDTDIFITPGFAFQVVDCLITNFHLPKSTLLMLVSAFIGKDEVAKVYAHAIQNQYRFFSYGDSSWLERKKNNFI